MFWDSVVAGLKILTYWEVYVAGIEYVVICYLPLSVAIAGATTRKVSLVEIVDRINLKVFLILMPTIHATALVVMFLTVAPIILGFSEDANWIAPWKFVTIAPRTFLVLVIKLVILTFIFPLIPVVGRMQSLQTLVLGSVTLMSIVRISVGNYVDFIPDFWFSVGLVIIGCVMSWISMMVAALLASVMDRIEEGLGKLLMFPVAPMFGFVPVFMYGAWLGAQIGGGH